MKSTKDWIMLETQSFDTVNRSSLYLVEHRVPERTHCQDPVLFDFDPEVKRFVKDYFGWPRLASQPPIDIDSIADFADEVRAEGLESVVLIGQGGSTQASMTMTKLHENQPGSVHFKTMDSMSPVYVHKILAECDPAKTIYLVSSKSGSTVEVLTIYRIVWDQVCKALGEERAGSRFVAITDPGSQLERAAAEQNWRTIFHGTPEVGGRFTALSIFGLLPAALDGIDIRKLIIEARQYERLCSGNYLENPAVQLAGFLYENYCAGRKIFSLVSPQPGRVFGLWVEQLIAESLGKNGNGILPNIEIDASILAVPRDDRCAITYAIRPDASFESDISRIDPSIPVMYAAIPSVCDIACHFIMWEYATAFIAVLMKVNPFDQPDVQSTKTETKRILAAPDEIGFTEGCTQAVLDGEGYANVADLVLEAELSPAVQVREGADLDEALEALFASLEPGDYFSVNAFLPFYREQRRVPLEEIRHGVAAHLGATSCLEIGPRYLHSTGQFHKGGPNTGVFLILSAEEIDDIDVPGENYTLGTLEHAQACGDLAALAAKGRRALRLHLADNGGETLARVSARICSAACKVAAQR